ncbi:nucleoporin NDC1-like isoform X2 [Amphiura filiformis]|uniref:nucleoporin NDC1-like isoform X2 n=1 Tax=Amphiura filiformis TaxID=82378 RepID=UPI003B21819C
MRQINHWYMRDVFCWRTGASVAWSVLLQPVAVSLYLLLITANLLHPYQWITDWLGVIFSLKGIGYSCLLGLVICIQACSNAVFYQVKPVVHLNRLSIIWNVICPSRFLYIVFHVVLAGFFASCCTGLVGGQYGTLVTICEEEEGFKECLAEEHLFLVLYGMYMGVLYGVNYFLQGSNCFEFPAIQLKFFQVKGYLSWSLYNSALGTLKTTAYFYLIYFIFGTIPKTWLLYNLDLHPPQLAVNSLRGLFNLHLFWSTWLTGTLLYHVWGLSLFLFKIFNTEVYRFAIETSFTEASDTCLYKALGEKQQPLVQYLAFQDVAALAEYSDGRRKEVYSLSQPGGHPNNWNRICTECLAMIESLTSRLMTHEEMVTNGMAQNKRASSEGDKSDVQLDPKRGYMAAGKSEPYIPAPVGTPYSPYTSSVFEMPTARQRHLDSTLGQQPAELSWAASPSVHHRSHARLREEKEKQTPYQSRYPSRPAPFWANWHLEYRIKQWRVMEYLLKPLPEAVNRSLFTDAQLHIWALEALSSFVAASYHEDTYGVVQGSLSDIMTTMLALQIAVDKHFKLPTSVSKKNLSDFRPLKAAPVHPDDGLRLDLKSTVKTSLHRVVATFGPNLRNVSAAPEYKRRLLDFMEYKQ